MEKDLLQAVIKVESEIQQSIESERKKAAAWLDSIRASLKQELEDKKEQLEKEYALSLEATCTDCEIQAKKEIAAVNLMTEHLLNLPDEYLQEVIREFLPDILPAEHR